MSKRLKSDKLETVGNLTTMQLNGGNTLNYNSKNNNNNNNNNNNTIEPNSAEESAPAVTVTQKGKKFDFSSNYFETF